MIICHSSPNDLKHNNNEAKTHTQQVPGGYTLIPNRLLKQGWGVKTAPPQL